MSAAPTIHFKFVRTNYEKTTPLTLWEKQMPSHQTDPVRNPETPCVVNRLENYFQSYLYSLRPRPCIFFTLR